MSTLKNATPRVENIGMRDATKMPAPFTPLQLPQHFPLFYTWAAKGTVGRRKVNLAYENPVAIYGDETFKPGSKFETHQMPYITKAAQHGNNMIVHRIIPDDINDRANLGLYLDVIKAPLPVYVRNQDGSFKLDENFDRVVELDTSGAPVLKDGIAYVFSVDSTIAKYGEYRIGRLTQRPGLIEINGQNSVQYPIMEFSHKDAGGGGNDLGIILDTINALDFNEFSQDVFSLARQVVYRFKVRKGLNDITGAKVKTAKNRFSEEYSKVVFGQNVLHPLTDGPFSLDKLVTRDYIKAEPEVASGLGEVHMYYNNIRELATMIKETESEASYKGLDVEFNTYKDDPEEYGFVDLIRMCNSDGTPYGTVQVAEEKYVDTVAAEGGKGFGRVVPMNGLSVLRFQGGFDGTMTKEVFERKVAADMDNYLDPLHEYSDIITHSESTVYDSGYKMETKYSLIKMIGLRKDTFVNLATFIDGENLNSSEQYSVGVALASRIALYPESSVFGTPAARGIIMGGSGEIIGSTYTKRVSSNYELLHKAARYMGAANGKWKEGWLFDHGDNAEIETLENIDVTWVPVTTRNLYWQVGINFILNKEEGRQFFPMLQSVYTDESSPMNSYFFVNAACFANKLSNRVWTRWSGVMSLSAAQMEERANEEFEKDALNRWDGVVRVVPYCTVKEDGSTEYYLWDFLVKMYGRASRTVMTTALEAHREVSI